MYNYKTRQQGGTVLGIIIGLIIGLGIALGVAVVINKTPMPFTNKNARHERSDTNANQAADPNRALYGNKSAAKEAAKAFVKEPAPAPAAAAAPAPADTQTVAKAPEPRAEAKSDNRGVAMIDLSTTDKPKKVEVRSPDVKEAVAKVEAAEDKWNYYLQAGAFREPTDAENTRAKLALMGVEARVSERQSENGTLYRVRVGPFAHMDAMNKVRGKLSDNGVDAAVVRIAK